MGRVLHVLRFGSTLVRYSTGEALQEGLAEARHGRLVPDTLLVLQHMPVFSLGKRGEDTDFRVREQVLLDQGYDIHRTRRGGQTTYHGPGQMVLYPIVGLRDLGRGVRRFVEGLEDTMIGAARVYGVEAEGRRAGATGVWVGERKLGAVGVRISEGVSTHGLALNVARHLSGTGSPFSFVVPCGMEKVEVTSLEVESGRDIAVGEVMDVMVDSYARVFGYEEVQDMDVDPASLLAFEEGSDGEEGP